MRHILLVTHGNLNEGFLSSLDMIVGSHEGIDTLSLTPKDTIESMMTRVEKAVNDYGPEDTVVVLSDIAIGTTTKACVPLLKRSKLFLISGVNLPLLLAVYLNNSDTLSFEELRTITEESKETIIFVNEQLQQN